MLLFRGLGRFGAIDPSIIQSTEGKAKTGQQVTSEGSVVKSPIKPLDPFDPPKQNSRGMIRAMGDIYRIMISRRAFEVQSALSQTVQTCINGRSSLDPKVQEACDRWLGPERLLMPIGVLDMLGVAFPVTELQSVGEDGKLEKFYTPDAQQRFLASVNAYLWSQAALAEIAGVEPSGNWEDFAASDDLNHGVLGAVARIKGSVSDLLTGRALVVKIGPDGKPITTKLPGGFVLRVPGFGLGALEPTQAELEDGDGLFKFYQRGGFVLYAPTITGETPSFWHELRFNVAYFKCNDGRLGVWSEKVPDEGHGWLAYVTFKPDGYRIRVQMKDRSTWESVKKAVGAVLSKTFEYMCKAAPLAKGVAEIAASTKTCTRTPPTNASEAQKQAAGCTPLEIAASSGTTPYLACQEKLRACKEGEPGCNCSTPQIQSKEQLALAASAQFLSSICNLPSDAQAVVSCDQLQPPPTGKWWWWLLGGVAAVGGGVWYASRK